MSLRSLLFRVHAGWVHLLNLEPSDVMAGLEGADTPQLGADGEANRLDAIGGQAVVEGVLMRSHGRIASRPRP